MALTEQQSFDCLGCSSGDRNIYIDDIMKAMIAFLNVSTCIPWVRSHENIDRPDIDATGATMGQYGLIEIIQSRRLQTQKPKPSADTTVNDNNVNLKCYDIVSERELTIQLNIYRENGEANRDQHTNTVVQPVGAGIDHLERLIDVYQVPRIKKALLDKGMLITDFSPIEWNKEIVKNTWENSGEMQITLNVCAQSSIADANIQCITLQICECEPKLICEPHVPEC